MTNTNALGHTIMCPQMLHQIITEPLMHGAIFILIMYMQERTQHKWIMSVMLLWPQYLTTFLIIVKVLFYNLGVLNFKHVL